MRNVCSEPRLLGFHLASELWNTGPAAAGEGGAAADCLVPDELPAETIDDAVAYWRRDDPDRAIRVASEYAPLADHYARERHLGRYRVIPISGASEAFVPDDAEILIEGSETGETMRANGLRMIDVIMESTACVIGSTVAPVGARGPLRDELVARLRAGVETSN